jgi:hypothetical protein
MMNLPQVNASTQFTSAEAAILAQIADLATPGADRILFYDFSANSYAFLTAGTGLTITGTTLTATGGGTGDVVGPASATDNAVVLFDTTTGKLIKDSTIKLVTTVFSPTASDGVALGSGTLMWSDLFLASGSVIDWNNGDLTLTHSANTLTLAGGILALPSSGFSINAVTVTSTGTQLNYLNAATGTTGTTSTNVVFSTSPTLVTPVLGVATATSINKVAITAPATSATLTIADGKTLTVNNSGTISGGDAWVLAIAAAKTLTVSNTLTLAGTDSTTMTFPSTSATIARTDAANTFTGASTASAWVLTSPTITTKISPTADDGAPLGDTTHNFSDLFLASGAVINFNNSNYTITHTAGLLTTNGNLSVNGTSGVLSVGTIELGHATANTLSASSGVLSIEGVVIPSISSTNTLTNKRMTRRLTTTNAPGATPTTNTDNVDIMNFTGLGTAITSMSTNLSGTPVDGDLIEFRFTDDGTARGITWGATFAATTVALPTTTVISTMLRVGFEYSGSTWKCIATA